MLKRLINAIISLAVGVLISTNVYAADESFEVSIKILTALSILETQALAFPITEATSSIQKVTIAPSDSTAASFDIGGESGEAISASISETTLDLNNGSTTITIDSFTFGGSCAADGTGTLTGGTLSGCKVGATATIPANPKNGTYSGNLTFRVLYN
jgi:hypothetical protein